MLGCWEHDMYDRPAVIPLSWHVQHRPSRSTKNAIAPNGIDRGTQLTEKVARWLSHSIHAYILAVFSNIVSCFNIIYDSHPKWLHLPSNPEAYFLKLELGWFALNQVEHHSVIQRWVLVGDELNGFLGNNTANKSGSVGNGGKTTSNTINVSASLSQMPNTYTSSTLCSRISGKPSLKIGNKSRSICWTFSLSAAKLSKELAPGHRFSDSKKVSDARRARYMERQVAESISSSKFSTSIVNRNTTNISETLTKLGWQETPNVLTVAERSPLDNAYSTYILDESLQFLIGYGVGWQADIPQDLIQERLELLEISLILSFVHVLESDIVGCAGVHIRKRRGGRRKMGGRDDVLAERVKEDVQVLRLSTEFVTLALWIKPYSIFTFVEMFLTVSSSSRHLISHGSLCKISSQLLEFPKNITHFWLNPHSVRLCHRLIVILLILLDLFCFQLFLELCLLLIGLGQLAAVLESIIQLPILSELFLHSPILSTD